MIISSWPNILLFVLLKKVLGVLGDNAAGMYATDTSYYDNDPEQLDGIAPSQPHREVDLAIIEADKQGTQR